MSLRKALFWLHLASGLAAGLVIALLCVTGAALAFQEEIVAWAERDVRIVRVPQDRQPLSVDDLRARVQAVAPQAKGFTVTVWADPAKAIAFSTREGVWFADPWTGEVRRPATRRTAHTMETMVMLHRWLSLEGGGRDAGRAITGAANLVFLVLALTGLILWWPRTWSWRSLKALVLPSLRGSSRQRHWNWHNSLGLWSTPILVVLTLTALPISYRWAGNLLFRLAGEMPPAAAGPGASPRIETPEPGTRPASPGELLARTQMAFPDWQQIQIRPGGGKRGERAQEGPAALQVSIREHRAWPRTATTTLTVHPFTGAVLERSGWKDMSAGRRLRGWTRFLHTGQALGPVGQFLAGLGCVLALVLVYTGFTLSWRRFFGRKGSKMETNPATV